MFRTLKVDSPEFDIFSTKNWKENREKTNFLHVTCSIEKFEVFVLRENAKTCEKVGFARSATQKKGVVSDDGPYSKGGV